MPKATTSKPLTLKSIGAVLKAQDMVRYAYERTPGLVKGWFAGPYAPDLQSVAMALGMPCTSTSELLNVPDTLRGNGMLIEVQRKHHTLRDDHVLFVQVNTRHAERR